MSAGRAGGDRAILFVDGDCALCCRLSHMVLAADAAGRLQVAPLSPADRTQGDAVVLVEGARTARAADAVVRTLTILGGRFGLLARVLRALPGPARAAAYRFVARRRRRWFGRVDSCPLPPSGGRPRG